MPLSRTSSSVGSGTRNSTSMFASMAPSLVGIASVGGAALAVNGMLSSAGLPSLTEIISNPLYLGGAALAAFMLLK